MEGANHQETGNTQQQKTEILDHQTITTNIVEKPTIITIYIYISNYTLIY